MQKYGQVSGGGVILAALFGLNGATGIKNLVSTSEDITNEQLPMLITDSRLAFNIAERVALSRGYFFSEVKFGWELFNWRIAIGLNRLKCVNSRFIIPKVVKCLRPGPIRVK